MVHAAGRRGAGYLTYLDLMGSSRAFDLDVGVFTSLVVFFSFLQSLIGFQSHRHISPVHA